MSRDDAELTPQEEWRFYFGFLLVLALTLGALLVVELILAPSPYKLTAFQVIGQALVWVWLIIGAFRFPFIRPFIRQAPAPHACIIVVLLTLVVCGHFTLSARNFFPIMSWAIFPGPNDLQTVSCREMIGIRADKSEVRLLAEQIFPSIIQFNLPTEDYTSQEMAQVIQAVAKEYNVLHPDAPVVSVDLREISVPIRPVSQEDKPTWKQLNSFPISGPSSS